MFSARREADFPPCFYFRAEILLFCRKYSIILPMQGFLEYTFYLLASFLAVTVVLTLHEFAHAFVAYKCGDFTPKANGRLSLNPLRHFDVLGLCLFAVAGFGWAKPVPINPNNFRHYRRGLAMTALAGVVMNYLTAFLFYPLFLLAAGLSGGWGAVLLTDFTYYLFAYSVSFFVFNLIPHPPLDGWRVAEAVNKKRGRAFRWMQRNGYYILIALIALHFVMSLLQRYLGGAGSVIFTYCDPLGLLLRYVVEYVSWPIRALWGLIF